MFNVGAAMSLISGALLIAGCSSQAVDPLADKSVRVAVIDTGIADLESLKCARITPQNRPIPTLSHGTEVASVILDAVAGTCPPWTKNVELQSVEVDSSGTAEVGAVTDGISKAVEGHSDVIVITAAFRQDDDDLRSAVDAAISSGVIVVAAAGNNAGLPASYPAAFPHVVSVGAFTAAGTLSIYSAREGVTTGALGEGVPVLQLDGSKSTADGTSIAAAIIASEICQQLVDGKSPEEAVSAVSKDHPVKEKK